MASNPATQLSSREHSSLLRARSHHRAALSRADPLHRGAEGRDLKAQIAANRDLSTSLDSTERPPHGHVDGDAPMALHQGKSTSATLPFAVIWAINAVTGHEDMPRNPPPGLLRCRLRASGASS